MVVELDSPIAGQIALKRKGAGQQAPVAVYLQKGGSKAGRRRPAPRWLHQRPQPRAMRTCMFSHCTIRPLLVDRK
jgi:hypothetical protein